MIVYVMGFIIVTLAVYIFILKCTLEATLGYMLSKGAPAPKNGELKKWIDWAIRNSFGNDVKPPLD